MKLFTGFSALVLTLALAAPAAFAEIGGEMHGGMHSGKSAAQCKHDKGCAQCEKHGKMRGKRGGKRGPGKGHANKPLSKRLFQKMMVILHNTEKLEISEAQKEKLWKLKRKTQKSVIRSKADVEIVKVDIEAELHEKKINKKALYSLLDKKYAAKKAMARKIVDAFAELKSTLSEDQWKALKKLHHKKR